MSKTALRSDSCPVCDADHFRSWRWHGLETCETCGHVRKSSKIDPTENDDVMSKTFDAGFALQDDFFTRFYENLNSRRRLRELQGFIAKGERVLEVGVGRGNLLVSLQDAGYQVDGLDLSDAVWDAVQSRYGVPVRCSTLEAYAEATPRSTYNAVIMCHVLEHIEALSPALRAVKGLLKEDGILYLAVPNVAAWNAYLPGWSSYEPYHLHYFCPKSLRRILESASFDVLYERTFEPVSGWFNAVVRSIRRRSPCLVPSVQSHDGYTDQNAFIWGLYNGIRIATGVMLSPIRWLQSAAGYGEELVMIAQYGFLR